MAVHHTNDDYIRTLTNRVSVPGRLGKPHYTRAWAMKVPKKTPVSLSFRQESAPASIPPASS